MPIIYPGGQHREIGAAQYEVNWDTVNPSAQGKDEIDFDLDVVYHCQQFVALEDAQRFARKVWDETDLCFGVVEIQKQVVDWFVEEDGIAEWVNVGDPEYVDGPAE